MTGHDLDRLRLLDTLAVGDGQHWPDLYSNPEQQRIAEVMYGAQADELLASSWLADGERDLRAKLAAAEQERDHWVAWCSVQARALAAVVGMGDWVGPGRILATAEQDEPKREQS